MKKNSIVRGAFILVVANILGKVIGAVYRIPLARILGSEGMGQYQLIFPLYALILTISTSGFPASISKLVAEYNEKKQFSESKKIVKLSLVYLLFLSIVGSVLVAVLSRPISSLQGNSEIYFCYIAIIPAIIFAGLLSGLRGYFQGNLKMLPTAISSLIEQSVKLVLGLWLASRLAYFGVVYAVLGAIIAIDFCELVSFLVLFVMFLIDLKKKKNKTSIAKFSNKQLSKQLFANVVPITFGGLITPLSSMIDSILVVNILMLTGFSNARATELLGISAGVVEPLIHLPVVVALSISVVLLPNISKIKASGNDEKLSSIVSKTFEIGLSISGTVAVCYFIFGNQILKFLYGGSFSDNDILLAIKLLFCGAFNVVFLSLVQISTSILQGLGKSKLTAKSIFFGCIIKIALESFLIFSPNINIFGMVVSGAFSYFFVFYQNFLNLKKEIDFSLKQSLFYISIQLSFVAVFAFFLNSLCMQFVGETLSMLFSGLATVCIFLATFYGFFYQKNETVVLNNKKLEN